MNIEIAAYQSKYFYLCDVDAIINDIMQFSKNENKKLGEIEGWSDKIFDIILKRSSFYTEYLTSSLCFFGSSYARKDKLSDDVKNTLINTFLINSYFSCFFNFVLPAEEKKGKNKKSKDKKRIINITSKNYSKLISANEDCDISYSNLNFYRRKKKIKEEYPFTYKLINLMNLSKSKSSTAFKVSTCASHANLCNFLITESSVLSFEKNINKNNTKSSQSNILRNYSNLYERQVNVADKLNNSIEKFIFSAQLNAIYGFNYFSEISEFLLDIYNNSNDDKFSLGKLDRNILLNCIRSVSDIPIYFNKFALLKYVRDIIEHTPNIKNIFLSQDPNSVAYSLSSDNEMELTQGSETADNEMELTQGSETADNEIDLTQRIETANVYLKLFIDSFKNITFPLLWSLWEISITHLLEKKLLNIDDIEKAVCNSTQSINNACGYNFLLKKREGYSDSLKNEVRKNIYDLLIAYYNFDDLTEIRYPHIWNKDSCNKYSPFDKNLSRFQQVVTEYKNYAPENNYKKIKKNHPQLVEYFFEYRKRLFELYK